MPPHLSNELASQPKSVNSPLVCGDHSGLRMTNTLPLESSGSSPAGAPDNTAMLPGWVANFVMRWVKKWCHLWRNFSGALMNALLTGIARGLCSLAAAALLEKERRPLGEKEELGRDGSKVEDGETLNYEDGHQGYLTLSSLERSQAHAESLIEDRLFGECPNCFFGGAKTDKIEFEANTTLCLIHHSISFGFEKCSESSSHEDMEAEGAECPGGFLQKSVEGLGSGGYFEENGEDSRSPHEGLEGDSRPNVGRPSVSQEHQESDKPSWDFVIFEEPSVESTPCFSKDGESLSPCGKAKENLGTPAASHDFKSPLVFSLFYSPSEEEDDDDSEDWLSDDEMEDTSQPCLDGVSAAEDNSQQQGSPENLHVSCFSSVDPLRSLCFSRSVQSAAFASPEAKKHKEVTVSFYIRKEDSKPEELFSDLPKPSSPEDQRSAAEHSPLRHCQLETERNCDVATTETAIGFQKKCQPVKKVRFSPKVTVHKLVVWDYASRAARRGPWEEMARDRCRFQRRIAEVGAVLEPCLEPEHRAKAWKKIHGAPNLVLQENTDDTCQSSARQEKLCI